MRSRDCILVKVAWAVISLFLVYFKANQMGFEKIFDNLTSKHMDALRNSIEQSLKMIQFLTDNVFNEFFSIHADFDNGYEN